MKPTENSNVIGNLLFANSSQKKIQNWWTEVEPTTIPTCPCLVKGNVVF